MKRKTHKTQKGDPRLTDEQYVDEDESQIEEEFHYRPERMERLPRGEFQRRHPDFDPETTQGFEYRL